METAQLDTQQSASAQPERPALRPPKRRRRWVKWLVAALAVLAVLWWFLLRPQGNAPLPAGQYIPVRATCSISWTRGTPGPVCSRPSSPCGRPR